MNYFWCFEWCKICLKPFVYLSLKQKKRVTISDYSLVENSIEISNYDITRREFINTCNLISFIIEE
jgi:hypothetical protein